MGYIVALIRNVKSESLDSFTHLIICSSTHQKSHSDTHTHTHTRKHIYKHNETKGATTCFENDKHNYITRFQEIKKHKKYQEFQRKNRDKRLDLERQLAELDLRQTETTPEYEAREAGQRAAYRAQRARERRKPKKKKKQSGGPMPVPVLDPIQLRPRKPVNYKEPSLSQDRSKDRSQDRSQPAEADLIDEAMGGPPAPRSRSYVPDMQPTGEEGFTDDERGVTTRLPTAASSPVGSVSPLASPSPVAPPPPKPK